MPVKKPISYFYPKEHLGYDPKESELTDLEKELIIHFRHFESNGMRKLFIQFAKLFGKFIPGIDFANMLYELTGEDYGFAASTFIESYYKKVLEEKTDDEK